MNILKFINREKPQPKVITTIIVGNVEVVLYPIGWRN